MVLISLKGFEAKNDQTEARIIAMYLFVLVVIRMLIFPSTN